MKRVKLTALILALMMIFSTITAAAASDPAVTVVSPASETVVYSDSLLISVKITKPETIRVSLSEEKQVGKDGTAASVDVSDLEALQAVMPVSAAQKAEDGAVAANVTAAKTADTAAKATAGVAALGKAAGGTAPVAAVNNAAASATAAKTPAVTNVTTVKPAEDAVKIPAASEEAAVVTTGTAAKFTSEEVMVPETFTSTSTLGFYTKQISDVAPGLYKLKVETIDGSGKVLYCTEHLVVVKGVVSEEEKTDLFETNPSGISQFFQNFLKSIFG